MAGAASHTAGHTGGSSVADVAIRRAPVPVRSSDLHTAGTSTADDDSREDRTLADFAAWREGRTLVDLDLCCAVRPGVLITIGIPATEACQCDSVNISPGGVTPTRIMAECHNDEYNIVQITHG